MMFVEPVALAAQSVAENAGTAQTAGILAGSTPELLSPVPMGADEDTIAFAALVAGRGGQFLASTGEGVASREAFGAAVGVSGVALEAMNVANAVGLAV
jgi:hypothetical protein